MATDVVQYRNYIFLYWKQFRILPIKYKNLKQAKNEPVHYNENIQNNYFNQTISLKYKLINNTLKK